MVCLPPYLCMSCLPSRWWEGPWEDCAAGVHTSARRVSSTAACIQLPQLASSSHPPVPPSASALVSSLRVDPVCGRAGPGTRCPWALPQPIRTPPRSVSPPRRTPWQFRGKCLGSSRSALQNTTAARSPHCRSAGSLLTCPESALSPPTTHTSAPVTFCLEQLMSNSCFRTAFLLWGSYTPVGIPRSFWDWDEVHWAFQQISKAVNYIL